MIEMDLLDFFHKTAKQEMTFEVILEIVNKFVGNWCNSSIVDVFDVFQKLDRLICFFLSVFRQINPLLEFCRIFIFELERQSVDKFQ